MLWHIINYFRKKNKLLHGGMQTLALIQLQMHKMQQIKTVPVCCLCRIATCSTLLRLIMVRMSDWALPFMTLSLSLATSSSSGPRGGISVLPHHGLNGEEQVQTVSFTCTQTAKLFVLCFCTEDMNYFRSHFVHMLQLTSCYKPSMHSTKIFGLLWLPVNGRFMVEQKFTCEKNRRRTKSLLPTKGVPFNTPDANEELVLQQNSKDEEDNAFNCHRKQVLPNKVPLQRVQSLFCA